MGDVPGRWSIATTVLVIMLLTLGVSVVAGVATARADQGLLRLSTTELDFGRVQVNTAGPSESVALTNQGLLPASLVDIAVTTSSAAFLVDSDRCEDRTLAAGSSCLIDFTYEPTRPGDDRATGTVTAKMLGLGHLTLEVDLGGTAVTPPSPTPTPTDPGPKPEPEPSAPPSPEPSAPSSRPPLRPAPPSRPDDSTAAPTPQSNDSDPPAPSDGTSNSDPPPPPDEIADNPAGPRDASSSGTQATADAPDAIADTIVASSKIDLSADHDEDAPQPPPSPRRGAGTTSRAASTAGDAVLKSRQAGGGGPSTADTRSPTAPETTSRGADADDPEPDDVPETEDAWAAGSVDLPGRPMRPIEIVLLTLLVAGSLGYAMALGRAWLGWHRRSSAGAGAAEDVFE